MTASLTDPVVTVAFFAILLLVACGVMAVVEGILERRERRAAREWNRVLRRSREMRRQS